MNSHYTFEEGSIALPDGFEDRTTNVFVLTNAALSPINFNITRDTLLPDEGLTAYLDRQLVLLRKNLPGYALTRREPVTLGNGEITGEQFSATQKHGAQTIHQRQAAFIHQPGRVLVFSCTGVRSFGEKQDAMWHDWLASFRASSAR
ncbi:hypothetical protein LIG30_4462 [Burkholderia sp. lig30]|jgi:hypothetical protein|uniref:DcrB-related protein n=1 Tax=Burkholderia sp. lig30 TaxID=1192124 RepID=UPI0004617EBF|nr:DUF1795 domain-containing protein [Burkholderia sp. lig30]KDB06074.1 hypothetical protein LIG30_4462 [Burkholderia sp. lig30]